MKSFVDELVRRYSAFGPVPRTPTELAEQVHTEQLSARARRDASRLARFGNREARRRGLKGLPGARRPLTAAEKAHRKVLRQMARASSRKANW